MVTPRAEPYTVDGGHVDAYLPMRPAWHEVAACRLAPGVNFFDDANPTPALRVCGTCASRVACLDFAQRERLDHGVFGGQTARTRINARRLAGRRANPKEPQP